MEWRIEKSYRDNDSLRHSFNELARATFHLDFEDWYQNGFWGDNYNPYSVVADGRVVANVSVNRTDFRMALGLTGAGGADGCRADKGGADGSASREAERKRVEAVPDSGSIRHFLQLGTVMTDKDYRNRGFIRKIMEEIEADYEGGTDGIYLFANDSVLDFYPKFGFEKSVEYQYSKKVQNTGKCRFEAAAMEDAAAWKRLQEAMDRNVFQGGLDLAGNHSLIMFYVTKFMRENVFYHKETDTYVIAETEGENVFLHNVFSGTLQDLDRVMELFGENIKEVTLGFAPLNTEKYFAKELHEADCTFFVKGAGMKTVEDRKLRIPSLARA